MFESLCLLLLSLQGPTPAQADAFVLALVSTPQPLADNLPTNLGPALERFWAKEQLWTGRLEWSPVRVRVEIEWTRQNWPNTLPDLSELDRLPTLDEASKARDQLATMRANLERLAEHAPPWNAEAVWIQRGELDACQYFWDEVLHARQPGNTLLNQRQALAAIRATQGDEAYFSGSWPSIPWWRIPRQ